MRRYDADQMIADLKRKQECKEKLTKEDMALLTICLMMEGKMPLKDRVKAAYQITKEAESAGQEELDKVETTYSVDIGISRIREQEDTCSVCISNLSRG